MEGKQRLDSQLNITSFPHTRKRKKLNAKEEGRNTNVIKWSFIVAKIHLFEI